jgi:glucose-6-phosphate isomerase
VAGNAERRLGARIERLSAEDVVGRIWARDTSVWKTDPATPELGDRLGWLDLPDQMEPVVPAIADFVADVRGRFDRLVLCGMGGSSLAPEVLWRTAGPRDGYLRLELLDSTHPEAVRRVAEDGPLDRTLVLVASKSGTTIETASFERFFWERTGGNGSQFVAVTDPGTELARRAREHGYRHVFLSPPDVGGRFSALSPFGLVPAALIGMDPAELLGRARAAAGACRRPPPENPAALLGALMGDGALAGRDKLTLLLDDGLASFGLWVEQLVAESTGKEGRGVLPVVGDAPDELSGTEPDRVAVVRGLGPGARSALGRAGERLTAAGMPVDTAWLADPHDLGAEFFRWEFATGVAGAILGVNPFDQPNVAESKTNTGRVLESGGTSMTAAPAEGLRGWLGGVRPGDYVAVMAYLPPGERLDRRLAALRGAVARRTGVAVTVGYGPRFLHSTGQLHKGGPQRGHFLQIVDAPTREVPIPGEPYGFGRLIAAQADGDLQALRARGRPTLRVADLDGLARELLG